ncbi:flagellar biosynthesis protein FlgA, partial [Burkholderia sp. AU32262]|nr:flagellar biosynthesis protein FlgA [Burkholderia sp. AU32262]
MTGGALRDRNGRLTHVRRAFALAAALWIAAPAVHADDGMIVIPGRGETAETALAHANAVSGGQFGANAGAASASGAQRAAGGASAATGAGYAAQPAGQMVVTSVPPPAAAPAPAPVPVYAARANAGYGASPRAADPAAIATVVAGTAEPASNAARPAPPPAASAP